MIPFPYASHDPYASHEYKGRETINTDQGDVREAQVHQAAGRCQGRLQGRQARAQPVARQVQAGQRTAMAAARGR
jgi:hypothetical protein